MPPSSSRDVEDGSLKYSIRVTGHYSSTTSLLYSLLHQSFHEFIARLYISVTELGLEMTDIIAASTP
jgi:hypothetical protein